MGIVVVCCENRENVRVHEENILCIFKVGSNDGG
jgi:hypothetical protein